MWLGKSSTELHGRGTTGHGTEYTGETEDQQREPQCNSKYKSVNVVFKL